MAWFKLASRPGIEGGSGSIPGLIIEGDECSPEALMNAAGRFRNEASSGGFPNKSISGLEVGGSEDSMSVEESIFSKGAGGFGGEADSSDSSGRNSSELSALGYGNSGKGVWSATEFGIELP